jgi:hypothetical protein
MLTRAESVRETVAGFRGLLTRCLAVLPRKRWGQGFTGDRFPIDADFARVRGDYLITFDEADLLKEARALCLATNLLDIEAFSTASARDVFREEIAGNIGFHIHDGDPSRGVYSFKTKPPAVLVEEFLQYTLPTKLDLLPSRMEGARRRADG